jgi:hypothetical protein
MMGIFWVPKAAFEREMASFGSENAKTCRHTTLRVSRSSARSRVLACGHVPTADEADEPGWFGGVLPAVGP